MSSIGQIAYWAEKEQRFIWIDKGKLPPPSQRERPAFYIVKDRIVPIRHPCNGKMYDSKSAIRAVSKSFGMVELGNDQPDIATFDEPIENYEEAIAETINEHGGWKD